DASAASKAYGLLRTAGARTSVGAGLPTVPILPVTHPWVPLPEPAPRREPPPAPAPQPDARRSDDSAWAAAMSADPAKTVLAPKDEPAGMRAHRVEETAWLIALDKLKPQPRPQPAGPDAGPAADAARRLFRRGRVAYI
ncbi:MAG: hypothetical protein LBT54_07810, partial [Bifidobacteriaceae bacterium]|nr:hypothetical protein [Bifidobacteriaceae bacterium]